MSEPEARDEHGTTASVKGLLMRLYRDPRYLMIGTVERHGRQRIAFIESCTVFSAAGEMEGQLLLNREYSRRGRPDGERPHECESLLDHYLSVEAPGSLQLDEDDIVALREESWQYYVRRNFAIQLGDYGLARDDAEHNLGIWNLVEQSQASEEAKWSYLKWWPWIERDRAVAQALLDLRDGEAEHAAAGLYRARHSILQYGRRYADQYAQEEGDSQSICSAMEQHINALVEALRREENLPVSLEEQLDQAAARGDEGEAQRLRAELIRRAMDTER